jgi:hypothetical protein
MLYVLLSLYRGQLARPPARRPAPARSASTAVSDLPALDPFECPPVANPRSAVDRYLMQLAQRW